MDGGAEGSQQPHLILANKLFLLTHPDVQDIEKVQLKSDVLDSIKSDGMAPLYETLAASSVLELDQSLLDSMRASNEEELKKLDEKIADAEENLGGTVSMVIVKLGLHGGSKVGSRESDSSGAISLFFILALSCLVYSHVGEGGDHVFFYLGGNVVVACASLVHLFSRLASFFISGLSTLKERMEMQVMKMYIEQCLVLY
ncbi:unnamed protein product [Brassica rapa subsp. trilocularis]